MSIRKALIVGVNYYEHIQPLFGCVDDAHSVKAMLDRHADGSVNFHTKALTGTGSTDTVPRRDLRDGVRELFSDDSDIALFYFSGHGFIDSTGGYLCPSDSVSGDDGVSMSDLMTWANSSKARNKVIMLDCCHSGAAGNRTIVPVSEISEGVTILTASTADQYATEENGSGVFTNLLVDALGGAAANLLGEITPGSVYAHIDQSLGSWGQRPVFKTNVTRFVSLRKVQPPLSLPDLRRIATLFPIAGYEFELDPSYEPMRTEADAASGKYPDPNAEHVEIFSVLQKYNRVNLVIPVNAPHMWHAAMESKSCRLTALGEHYRQLAMKDLL